MVDDTDENCLVESTVAKVESKIPAYASKSILKDKGKKLHWTTKPDRPTVQEEIARLLLKH